MSIKIKRAQFFYKDQKALNFIKKFNQIDGYGNVDLNFENKILFGSILNPSGYIPAVFYKTGLLVGNIINNIGSFTWENITLEGPGEQNKVFFNYATGYRQATGTIEIDAFYKTNLSHLDSISINDVNFTYVTGTPQNLFEFNTIERFVEVLNLGSQGFYNNPTLQNTVGVSATIDYTYPFHKIYLTSVSKSGDEGNSNKIYRDSANLELIKIKNRYFQGGRTFRPVINSWDGYFSNTFSTLTVENSGFYSRQVKENVTATIQDVVWEDNFSGNYYITTGIRNPNNIGVFSGGLIPFDQSKNKYYGFTIIPSGSSLYVYTGLVFNILKPNPYNIRGNLAKYTLSGNNFIFSGIIEG